MLEDTGTITIFNCPYLDWGQSWGGLAAPRWFWWSRGQQPHQMLVLTRALDQGQTRGGGMALLELRDWPADRKDFIAPVARPRDVYFVTFWRPRDCEAIWPQVMADPWVYLMEEML